MADRISIEKLRQAITEHGPSVVLETNALTFEPDDLLALVEAVEAAHALMAEPRSWNADVRTQALLNRYRQASDRFDFGEAPRG